MLCLPGVWVHIGLIPTALFLIGNFSVSEAQPDLSLGRYRGESYNLDIVVEFGDEQGDYITEKRPYNMVGLHLVRLFIANLLPLVFPL